MNLHNNERWQRQASVLSRARLGHNVILARIRRPGSLASRGWRWCLEKKGGVSRRICSSSSSGKWVLCNFQMTAWISGVLSLLNARMRHTAPRRRSKGDYFHPRYLFVRRTRFDHVYVYIDDFIMAFDIACFQHNLRLIHLQMQNTRLITLNNLSLHFTTNTELLDHRIIT